MRAAAVIAAALAALAGCAVPGGYGAGLVGRPPEGSAEATVPDARTLERVRFADVWQAEEYLRFDREGSAGELVLLAADPDQDVALDNPYDPARAIRLFRHNAGAGDPGPAGRVDRLDARIFWRPYAIPAAREACATFGADWWTVGDDPEKRPRYATLGYVCGARNGPLPEALVTDLLERLAFEPERAAVAARGLVASAEALAAARGAAGDDHGVPAFPFRLARPYVPEDRLGGF